MSEPFIQTKEQTDLADDQGSAIHDFLSRYVPSQVANPQKLCYRHRPDLVRKRMPDSFNFQDVQKQMEKLPTADRVAITHIWSLFSAAPADQRTLILKGILSTCCMPQLSFLHDAIKPLLRIDFISILPREVSLQVFSYLDAKSLCHAAQVSQTWKQLADDDTLWHRMCEQHIDKKCAKCGWGLPLLDKKRSAAVRKRPISATIPVSVNESPLRTACGPSTTFDPTPSPKRAKTSYGSSVEAIDGNNIYPASSSSATEASPIATPKMARRPWKDVYSERLIVERNWRNDKYRLRVLSGHTDGVMCVQFCDLMNVLMTGSYDKTVRVWNMETGQEVRVLTGHTRCVRALQFDDAKLVTGAMDNTLKIWNWHTGQCIRTLEGHTGGVLSLHFDSRILASGSTDRTIRVWNFQAGECCTLTGHTEWVNSVRLFRENMLVSGSDDATIRLWDLQTRECLRVFRGHVGQVQVALPSPIGFTHQFDIDASVLQQAQRTSAQQQQASSGVTTMRGANTTGFQPGCATTSNRRSATPDTMDTSSSCSSSDAPIVLSGSLDNTIKLWDVATGTCLRTLFGHVEGVWSLAYDKLRIVSGSHDKTIRVWDTESGRCMHHLEGHNGPVTAVALSDTKIVSASDDGDVRIWDYGIHSK
ncbi:quinon protein alcohol dehydrogenase-like superfamily [Radiomyces spectabilis]|uniref:quinon protein alcohol dehydrogenase-like superfamily n=1 Tax=Radiomyces spectabilis TaxID=64574 RepID=UPI00221F0D18|nr:quinon protein alcohol dehydrogenase-like superfamily [Radiomyces spectabilis]KAI8381470.1 quinon protein alcohol dehydrogenase-like superfamily [Radiomyces spectabilis]